MIRDIGLQKRKTLTEEIRARINGKAGLSPATYDAIAWWMLGGRLP